MPEGDRPVIHRSRPRLIWLLLLVPYISLLWVPFYDFLTPEVWGFPFFYWYQLLWVPITAFLTWLVYRRVRHDD
jgi:membrane protein implicated in regulation of membrane protease activity